MVNKNISINNHFVIEFQKGLETPQKYTAIELSVGGTFGNFRFFGQSVFT